MQLGTLEGTFGRLGNKERADTKYREGTQSMCHKKNNAIATKIYFRKKLNSNLRGFTLHLELLIPVADDVTFDVGMDREVILTGVLSSIRS